MSLTDQQLHRYARHVILDEVGEEGQLKLLHARVLVIGAGGLGAPVLLYLAAAGVGTIGIVDHDVVDLTNLQRQIVHGFDSIGEPKVKSAVETLARINPEIRVTPYPMKLDAGNAMELISGYDLVIDGSDNFPTRYLLIDACFHAKKTLIAASLLRFEGQLLVQRPDGPCLRCLYPEAPPEGLVPRCEQAGILGAVAGVMGTLQATEAIKEIIGLGETMAGRLLIYDALSTTFRTVKYPRDPDCALCGPQATIILRHAPNPHPE